MSLFGKKLSDEELIKKNIESQQAEVEEKEAAKQKKQDDLGDSKLGIEITKLKAQLEGLNEQRVAVNERFSHISEEIGEIRGMVMDTNKAVGNIEASATKAIDLVESVKPDQLMLEVRKQDSKIESLKANIESNESLMRDMMKEVKEIRKRMDFYKGVEQVAKMNEEIKKELIEIKKTESVLERHSNKIETIFIEVSKKYTEFDKYGDTAKDLQRTFQKLQADVDKLRVKGEDKADKKELLKFITKFNDFEKHTTNIINLMDERSKNIQQENKNNFESLKKEILDKFRRALKRFNIEMTQVEEQKEKTTNTNENTNQKTQGNQTGNQQLKKKWSLFGSKNKQNPVETSQAVSEMSKEPEQQTETKPTE